MAEARDGWVTRLEELYCAGGEAAFEQDEIEWLRGLQCAWQKLFPPAISSSVNGNGKGKAHGNAQPPEGRNTDVSSLPVEEQLCAAMLEAVLKVRSFFFLLSFFISLF